MNRQNKKIYSSLMNRIAIAMMLNQLVMAILGGMLVVVESILKLTLGEGTLYYMIDGLFECAVYLLAFAIPMNIFNKMNKKSDREIYEPVESEKMPSKFVIFAVGLTLGATVIASYINFYAVNAIWDYSEFTTANLWSVELNNPCQIIIYFAYSAIIPALAEEYFFRETICKSLKVYGKGTAIIISATLFSLMHANIEQILYAFVAGILLAWIYVETKNIAIPILVHFLNNGISALGDIINAVSGSSARDMYFSLVDPIIIIFAVISLVVLAVYAKKRGWLIEKLILKPDENGEAVAPLSVKERVSGFFSTGIVLYTAYALFTMIGLIYLSLVM